MADYPKFNYKFSSGHGKPLDMGKNIEEGEMYNIPKDAKLFKVIKANGKKIKSAEEHPQTHFYNTDNKEVDGMGEWVRIPKEAVKYSIEIDEPMDESDCDDIPNSDDEDFIDDNEDDSDYIPTEDEEESASETESEYSDDEEIVETRV